MRSTLVFQRRFIVRRSSLRLACVCIALGVAGCGRGAAPPPAKIQAAVEPTNVPVTEAQRLVWPRTLRVQGNLLSNEQSTLGSKLAARVDDVHVDLGSPVKRNQLLVSLEARDLELRVQQMEAQLAQACAAIGLDPADSETNVDRQRSPLVVLERAMLDEASANSARGELLLSRKAITDSEFERLKAQLQAAEARHRSAINSVGEKIALITVRRAELALARQQVIDTRILAPFDGMIQRRHVSNGEHLQVGSPVVTLVRTDPLRFTAGVPERTASKVRKGQTILIQLDGEARPLEATVSRVSPAIDAASRALLIEADVPNPDLRLRTGLFAEAEIVIDPAAETLVVPASAILEFAGIEKIWIVRDGQGHEQPVRTGRRDRERVEILDGLPAGSLVVTRAADGRLGPLIAVRGSSLPAAQAKRAGTAEPETEAIPTGAE